VTVYATSDSGARAVALLPGEAESEARPSSPPVYYDYAGSKSVEAFKLTVTRFFAKHKRIYLWTFTFADVVSLDESSRRWALLRDELVRRFGLEFIRVLERHQSDHGVHWHALIPRWFPVRVMRRVAKRCGFGRIHCLQQVPSARFYLAKHFAKTKRGSLLSGRRLWATCGIKRDDPTRCKVADLTVWTREHEIFRGLVRRLKEETQLQQLHHTQSERLFRKARAIFTREICAGRRLVHDDDTVQSRAGRINLVFN